MEKRHIRIYRLLTLFFSFLLIILILYAWIKEGFLSEWKKYQYEFREITAIEKKDQPVAKDMIRTEIGIRELDLEALNRIDRCISCHLGIENPEMLNIQQPHTVHSGKFIANHPTEKYGCTICHGGQGRALTKVEAFGREEQTHWLYPILDQPYIQSSCGKCHLVLFGEDNKPHETETLMKGLEVFKREGCLGCHQARGVGATVGPDLTEQGEKTRHEYNFQNINGEQTVSNWLREHFRDPEVVSPGSQMLKMNLKEDEIEALVTFILGLAKPDIPFEYFSIGTLNEHKGARNFIKGTNLYHYCCSACHGKAKEGKNWREYGTGVPSLGNRDFLSIASGSFIRFTILNGRSWKQMASWLPEFSGLSESEIDSAVDFIKSAKDFNSSFAETTRLHGDVKNGMGLYSSNCYMCHGDNEEGIIGLPLKNANFLMTASNRFIYNTISNGRYNTAMPSWSYLDNKEMSDIIAYIRSFGTEYSPYQYFWGDKGNEKEGTVQFHYLCSRCHGENGDGGTGPAILNSDFLNTADDLFLYTTIGFGRAHTAMFGWRGQKTAQGEIGDKQINDIIAFMRSTIKTWDYIYPGANPGNSVKGAEFYLSYCAECHGETGSGILAPALNNQEFLNAATNGYILATISLGRKGTNMPSWGKGSDRYSQLTSKQRQDIASFIRSWQKINIKYNFL